jgi:hypothetical protein
MMIVFTQIRIVAINYNCHPTLSGVGVPTLVGIAATHQKNSPHLTFLEGFVLLVQFCVVLSASICPSIIVVMA